jgi:hypothetical protein
MEKNKIILICGPWGSGSSALTGFLTYAGFYAPTPFHTVPDPLTPNTFETNAFRLALAPFVSEFNLKKTHKSSEIIDSLNLFNKDFLYKHKKFLPNKKPFFLLKHPTSVFFLDELFLVFDVYLVCINRSLSSIENTRIRRNWPSCYGQEGARVIYDIFLKYAYKNNKSFLSLSYDDLILHPRRTIEDISEFLGLTLSDEEIKNAIDFISDRT